MAPTARRRSAGTAGLALVLAAGAAAAQPGCTRSPAHRPRSAARTPASSSAEPRTARPRCARPSPRSEGRSPARSASSTAWSPTCLPLPSARLVSAPGVLAVTPDARVTLHGADGEPESRGRGDGGRQRYRDRGRSPAAGRRRGGRPRPAARQVRPERARRRRRPDRLRRRAGRRAAGPGQGRQRPGPVLRRRSPAPTRYLDGYGHGTHMAGIIAGRDDAVASPVRGSDTTGFTGIAPDARLVNVKVADSTARPTSRRSSPASTGSSSTGVTATSTSGWSTCRSAPTACRTTGSTRWRTRWSRPGSAGIVVVVAAGNEGFGSARLNNPAYDPYVSPSAAATAAAPSSRDDDVVAPWSSRGDADRHPDLVAPGQSVVSLRSPGSYLDADHPGARIGDRFFRGSGTSQATAVVSGAAALLLQQRPGLTPDQVKALLTRAAPPTCPCGDDVGQGAGLLDVQRRPRRPDPRRRDPDLAARAGHRVARARPRLACTSPRDGVPAGRRAERLLHRLEPVRHRGVAAGRLRLVRRRLDRQQLDRQQLDGWLVAGQQLDRQQLDREQLDGQQLDREQLDGQQLDGQQLDRATAGPGTAGRATAGPGTAGRPPVVSRTRARAARPLRGRLLGAAARRARRPSCCLAFSAALAAGGGRCSGPGRSDSCRRRRPTYHLPWLVLLAAGFLLAEVAVVHYDFRSEAHSLSVSELPLVFGLFFAPPSGVVTAHVVGAGLALVLHRRQVGLKLVFNLAHFALGTCLAVLVFAAVRSGWGHEAASSWGALLAAVVVVRPCRRWRSSAPSRCTSGAPSGAGCPSSWPWRCSPRSAPAASPCSARRRPPGTVRRFLLLAVPVVTFMLAYRGVRAAAPGARQPRVPVRVRPAPRHRPGPAVGAGCPAAQRLPDLPCRVGAVRAGRRRRDGAAGHDHRRARSATARSVPRGEARRAPAARDALGRGAAA